MRALLPPRRARASAESQTRFVQIHDSQRVGTRARSQILSHHVVLGLNDIGSPSRHDDL